MANTNATTHTVEDVTDFSGSGTVLYTGRLVDNKRDGRGVCWWPTTGEQYDGEWQQGQKDGWGQWRGPDGETFEGLHRGGRWARGRCLSTDGTLRDGSWVQVRTGAGHSYQMQGWGVQRRIVRASTTTTTTTGADSPAATRAMETVYEGEWDRHEWHGRGIWRSPRGTGDVYDGEFDHGKRSGYGRMMFGEHSQGGGIYVGGWKDDVFHGRGVRIWDDGTRYEGDWVCGKMHGAGKKWERDGTVIEGVWENGVIKSGKVTWPNGDEFAGRFSDDGVGEGNAKFKNSDGRVTTSGVGALQKGVFKESGGGTHFLGCGGSDSGAAERISALENENSQLKHQLKQVEERAQASEVKANELLDALNAVEHQLSEQTKLLSVRSEEVKKQEECFSHVLQHIQQGSWIKSTLPAQQTEPSNKCVMKEVSVTLERHDITFHEQFCCLCPFDKIVKMEIEKRFGIDENHQVVSVSAVGAHEQAEVPCSSTSTLSQSLSVRESEECKLQVKVRLTPILDIQEKHLIMSSSLGSGSYGTVFKSKHIPSSTDVAVKTLHDAIAEKYSVDRFRLEAEIVSGLRHPNIVKCIGTCNSSVGKLMLVSELMCCSLRQLLRQKNLKFQEAVAIALGIAKGMDALHRQNYMHGDLNSSNILFDKDGTPKICDFISATKCIQPAETRNEHPGVAVYMSPQMFTRHFSQKGDLWSFGIVTTEMISGNAVDVTLHSDPETFLNEQKRKLTPDDAEEVDKLCREASKDAVMCCLNRRDEFLRAVDTIIHSADSPLFSVVPPRSDLTAASIISALGTAPDRLFSIVQTCLSICESNRQSFTAIVETLQGCCTTTAVTLSSSSSSPECIAQWLSSLGPLCRS
ncbi:phosphatidylinositol 4-phosphate 5-kinase 8 [Pelomyxa schiedti]|nr:phosphatidylinositol 4-phosphate 5-kinase 8 [Pelomyxa schiedti]